MNDSTRAMRRPQRAWLPAARTAAAIIAAAALVLPATACSSPSSTGSGGSPNARASANSPSLVSYSRCMRSHGVPNFPDPTRSTPAAVALGAPSYMFQMGGLPGLDGRSFPPQVRTAMHECLRLTHLAGSQVPDWSG